MSNRYLTWAFIVRGVSPSEKLVLIKLADQANDDGKCWPSQTSIGEDCGLSRESVSRIIRRLAEVNLVTVIPRKRDGVNLPNVYELPLIDVAVTPRNSEGGSVVGSQGVGTYDHNGSNVRSHKPSLNPHIEPSLLGEPSASPPFQEKRSQEKNQKTKPERELPDECPTAEEKKEAAAFWKNLGVAIDVEAEAANFRDHHQAKGTRFRDWSAAWRLWRRNAAKFVKAKAPGGQSAASGRLDLSWTKQTNGGPHGQKRDG